MRRAAGGDREQSNKQERTLLQVMQGSKVYDGN